MNSAPATDRAPFGVTSDLFGLAVVLVAACALTLTVFVWTGAQLAALLSGHGFVAAGLDDAARAMRKLPAHLDDPRTVWPTSVQRQLGGAPSYWAGQVVAFTTFAASVGCATRATARYRRSSNPLGVRPHAGFARPRDVRDLAVDAPVPGRVTIGHARNRLLACEPQASLAVVGPTGCGKTAGFAIPALLEWRGPVLATSVKTDLLEAALEHRRRRGHVWTYDPTRCSGHATTNWTPLSACTTWAGAIRIAAWLCEAAQPRLDTVTDGDYWYTQARRALAPYLYAAAVSGRSMRDLVRWIDAQEQDEVEDALREHAGINAYLDDELDRADVKALRDERREQVTVTTVERFRAQLIDSFGSRGWWMQKLSQWPLPKQQEVQQIVEDELQCTLEDELAAPLVAELATGGELDALVAAQSLWNKEDRLRGSVFATVENVLAGYADPSIGQASEGRGLDLDGWLSGDNTIFVVATAHEQARLRPVLSVLIQQAIRSAYEAANRNHGTLPRPCLVLLDEAGNIAPLRDLPGYASTARSHGITLVSVWQDLAQVKAIYGDRAHTVLNNHRAKLFGTGIADEATLEYVSRLIGDERHTEINLSGEVHGSRRTMTEHRAYRRAAPIDVLRRIRTNEAVLLYGSQLPVLVKLRPWFVARRHGRRA
jgi:type IV secretion system protein VirD4